MGNQSLPCFIEFQFNRGFSQSWIDLVNRGLLLFLAFVLLVTLDIQIERYHNCASYKVISDC